jgi:hypothetical protein
MGLRSLAANVSAPDVVRPTTMRLSFLVIGSEHVMTVFRASDPVCARTSSIRLQCTASSTASALATASAGVPARAPRPASLANRSSFFSLRE